MSGKDIVPPRQPFQLPAYTFTHAVCMLGHDIIGQSDDAAAGVARGDGATYEEKTTCVWLLCRYRGVPTFWTCTVVCMHSKAWLARACRSG